MPGGHKKRPDPTVRILEDLYRVGAGLYVDYLYNKGYSGQRLLGMLERAYPEARVQSLEAFQQRVVSARAFSRSLAYADYDIEAECKGAVRRSPDRVEFRVFSVGA